VVHYGTVEDHVGGAGALAGTKEFPVTPRHVSAAFATVAVALAAVVVPSQPAAGQQSVAGQLDQSAPAGPVLTVDPEALTSVQGPDERVTHQLTIGNLGDAELEWSVVTDTDAPRRLPIRSTTPVRTAPVPDPGGRGTLETFPGFRGRPGWTVEPELPPTPPDSLTATHSESPTIVAGSAVACSRTRGFMTLATSYLRHFTLTDFGIVGDLDVTAVAFGVENLRGNRQPLTVNLYTMVDPDGLFTYDNFQLIGTAEMVLSTQSMTMVRVPVTGTAPAGSTLVVEVAAPDLSRGSFHIGANPDGQTAPSYLRAVGCGIPEPTPTDELGVPGMGVLLDVTGVAEVAGCDVPTGTPWVAVDPAGGAVAPGGAQAVGVTFDSTGLPVGEVREADLCLASNDPDRPLVVVPLTLRVEEIPAIEVTPAALAVELPAGTVTDQALTVGNIGDGSLEWEIGEAEPTGCGAAAEVPWLSVSPASGATAAGTTTAVTATVDATDLAVGEVAARLCVTSNDPATPLVEVPVSVTVTVPCDDTIVGLHPGPLTVTEGVTCLAPGARVEGEVNVLDGAGLVADSAVVQGPLSTFGATFVELTLSQVVGPISVRGTTERVVMSGTQVVGSVLVVNNRTGDTPALVSGNWIVGSLFCTGNQPAPVDGGVPNTVIGGMKLDQCAGL
jgi:hypothetical protein